MLFDGPSGTRCCLVLSFFHPPENVSGGEQRGEPIMKVLRVCRGSQDQRTGNLRDSIKDSAFLGMRAG